MWVSRTIRAISVRRFASWYYTVDHEWLRYDEKKQTGVIGITEHAQQKLGEVVHIELPKVGSTCKQGEIIGDVDSTGVVDHFFTPISGTVLEVNQKLKTIPHLLNSSPLEDGWVAKVQVSDPSEISNLMDEEGYRKMIEDDFV